MFFSQQGVTNNSFPCNTVAGSRIGSRNITEWCWSTIQVGLAPSLLSTWGSTTPWAEAWAGIIKISCLCDPNQMILVLKVTNINREELTFSSCTSLDDVTPWCYTRIQVGRVSFPNFSNCRKTCWPLTATGVTARLPAPGSCPLPPASTVSLLDQIFGTLRSSTSPPGVLAFATHMIRPLRWLLFDCQPQEFPQIPFTSFVQGWTGSVRAVVCIVGTSVSSFLSLFFVWHFLYINNLFQRQGCACGWVPWFQYLPARQRPVLARPWNGRVDFAFLSILETPPQDEWG